MIDDLELGCDATGPSYHSLDKEERRRGRKEKPSGSDLRRQIKGAKKREREREKGEREERKETALNDDQNEEATEEEEERGMEEVGTEEELA